MLASRGQGRAATTMPIQSIEPRRLYRQIADQIRSLVRSGEYTAGQRLPPERDLARQLGVSRPSVREALIALEVEGLVEVRIGSGIYVVGGGGNSHGDEVQAASGPFELLRARWIIEGECAALAAKSAKKEHIVAIEDALLQMQRIMETDKVQPLAADRLFHLRVAEATGNGALVAVLKMLWEERMGPLFSQLEHHYDTPELWVAALAEHRNVLKAIVARDADTARAAMQKHLNKAYKRFNTGWDARQ